MSFKSETTRGRPAHPAAPGLPSFIRARREELDLGGLDVFAKCGVTPTTVSLLERGMANPTLSTLEALAEGLDCTLIVRFEPKESE